MPRKVPKNDYILLKLNNCFQEYSFAVIVWLCFNHFKYNECSDCNSILSVKFLTPDLCTPFFSLIKPIIFSPFVK